MERPRDREQNHHQDQHRQLAPRAEQRAKKHQVLRRTKNVPVDLEGYEEARGGREGGGLLYSSCTYQPTRYCLELGRDAVVLAEAMWHKTVTYAVRAGVTS